MPELPEVETISYALNKLLIDKKIKGHKLFEQKLRFSVPSNSEIESLYFNKIIKIFRVGKILFLKFKSDLFLTFHFGMTGFFRYCDTDFLCDNKYECIRLVFGDNSILSYFSIRKFGAVQLQNSIPEIPIDPLSSRFDFKHLINILKNRKSPIKQVLMNQKLISGIGNICANEALFEAGVLPNTRADKLNTEVTKKLIVAIKSILNRFVRNGKSNFDKSLKIDENTMKFPILLQVYGRANLPCKKCKQEEIANITICGRSSFYCPNCQK